MKTEYLIFGGEYVSNNSVPSHLEHHVSPIYRIMDKNMLLLLHLIQLDVEYDYRRKTYKKKSILFTLDFIEIRLMFSRIQLSYKVIKAFPTNLCQMTYL